MIIHTLQFTKLFDNIIQIMKIVRLRQFKNLLFLLHKETLKYNSHVDSIYVILNVSEFSNQAFDWQRIFGHEKKTKPVSFFPKVFRLDKIIHACMNTSMQIRPLIFSSYNYLWCFLLKYVTLSSLAYNNFVDTILGLRILLTAYLNIYYIQVMFITMGVMPSLELGQKQQ